MAGRAPYGSHMPPCPRVTVFEHREAAGFNTAKGYPFGEAGTSKSRPPLPTETTPRPEDIALAMQKGKFVEASSSTPLAITTTKAVEMEWVNIGSSSGRLASQYDDFDLELEHAGSLLETRKLLRANVKRLKPNSSLTFNFDDIDDGLIADRDANVKRLKVGESSNTKLETSSVQAAPNKRGDNESMPIVIDGSDGEADCPSAHAWLRRWLFNGGKLVKKPEGMGPPDDGEPCRPSLAAMALMGRAILNDYQKSCEVQKRGGVTVWKT